MVHSQTGARRFERGGARGAVHVWPFLRRCEGGPGELADLPNIAGLWPGHAGGWALAGRDYVYLFDFFVDLFIILYFFYYIIYYITFFLLY